MAKKLFSLSMVVFLLFSFTGTTYAKDAAALSKQGVVQSTTKLNSADAVKIAKKALKDYFNFDIDEKEFQSNSQLSQGYNMKDSYVWNLNWNSYNGSMNKFINITIDANSGKILSINKSENQNTQSTVQIAKYTETDAQKAVEDFLQKIDPNIIKNTVLIKNPYYKSYNGFSPGYDFKYVRLVNGIEYNANYVEVGYDGTKGTVVSYNNSWDDTIVFPDKEKVVDAQTATENFNKALKMKLQYITKRDSNSPEQAQTIKLVYAPYFDQSSIIDATNGETLKQNPYEVNTEKTDLSNDDKDAFLKSYKEAIKPDKEIDRDKAEQVAKEILDKITAAKGTITNMAYQQSNYNGMSSNPTWSGQFSTDSEDLPMGNITIDAVTGQLSSLNCYYNMPYQTKFTPKLTWKEAYAKAIDFIKQVYPDRIKDIITEQTYYKSKSYMNGVEMPSPTYNFQFTRKINDISASNNSINIAFDTKTGTVNNVFTNWDDSLKFPEAKNIISSENAHKAYMDSIKLSLGYISYNKSTDSDVKDLETKLVYISSDNDYPSPDSVAFIDAASGKLLNYNGEDIADATNNEFATKIKGNQYEMELSKMVSSGTIDTKNFNPDKVITKGDVIKAMILLKGGRNYYSQQYPELKFTDVKKDDENYIDLQKAVSFGILNNESIALNLSQVITKEEVIKYLIDVTPFGALADSKGIFTLNYSDVKDISEDKYGDIAIAKGLKILDDNIDKLNPKSNVKMDELYHYIFKVAQYVKAN